jgi:Na+/H+ antiporter NhaD/arsenite permease-like protein
VWGAWRARRGPHGILPFVLLIAVLAANMSSNYVALKLFWLVMALGAAVGSAATRTPLGGGRRC